MRWVVAALIVSAAACGRDVPEATPGRLPNTPALEHAGEIEFTTYEDKIVLTNHTTTLVTGCVVTIDDQLRGELGTLAPAQTLTIMRTRFSPYTEAKDFYRRGKTKARMDCQSPTGPVTVHFKMEGEYQMRVDKKG